MNDEYKIIDTRTSEDFKKSTFSGYKKRDVYRRKLLRADTNAALNRLTRHIVLGRALYSIAGVVFALDPTF